ncbi:MAG: hypothetical protein H7838_02265 [Magnetococcus sp. DMHC-8]
MTISCHDHTTDKLDRMVNLLANDGLEQAEAHAVTRLKPRSRKTIGMATGGAIGSVIPGVGSLLGALIGYSLADSQWVANRVDRWLAK